MIGWFGESSQLRHGRLSAKMAGVAEWLFNPNLRQAFSFPAFGTAELLTCENIRYNTPPPADFAA